MCVVQGSHAAGWKVLDNISFSPGATEKGDGDAARTSDGILINAFPGRKESQKQFWLPLSAACSINSER